MRQLRAARLLFAAVLLLVTSGYRLQGQQVGVIEGSVAGLNGDLILDATITVTGTRLSVRSAEQGHFIIRSVPDGPQVVRVQRFGFQFADFEVTVVAGQSVKIDARLALAAVTLDTSRIAAHSVNGKPARLSNTTKYDEFYARRNLGIGHYFTHDDLEQRAKISIPDALSSIPSVRVRRVAGHFQLSVPGCTQESWSVFIDNQQVFPTGASATLVNAQGNPFGNAPGASSAGVKGVITPLDILADLSVEEVEAIEVYKGSSSIPAIARGNSCAAIMVWTR